MYAVFPATRLETLDTVQIQCRDAQDFKACYDDVCAMQDSAPLPAVKANLSQGMLDFNEDRLKLTNLWLSINSYTISQSAAATKTDSVSESQVSIK